MSKAKLLTGCATALVMLLFSLGQPGDTQETALTPVSAPAPDPTPAPTQAPSKPPDPIELPEKLPRPTPAPTLSPGVQVTAEMTVERCQRYASIVDFWLTMEMKPSDRFRHISDKHRQLILAIMAQESACIEDATDGLSYGLMQVIPRDWLPNAYHNNTNVLAGMYILDGSLGLADGDMRLALAYYNCGVPKVQADACGAKGGINYATDVLEFWLPFFQ